MTSTQFAPSRFSKVAAHSARKKPPPSTAQEWITRKERGCLLALRFMTWFAHIFGRPVARLALYPITLYYILTARQARRASRDYLARIYGRRAGWHDIFFHIHTFASVLLDRIYFLLGQHAAFDIRIINDDYGISDAAEREKGVFLMGAHMGSFEAVRMLGHQRENLPLVLLMYEENARKISSHFSTINPCAQQEIIPLGQLSAMLTVKKRLAQGAVVGMLADRFLGLEKTAILPFLQAPASFAQGPFRMAALMRRPVYFMTGLYVGGNRYDIYIERIADFTDDLHGAPRNNDADIHAAMAHYVSRLEYFARLAPLNWFNFYDFWQEHG